MSVRVSLDELTEIMRDVFDDDSIDATEDLTADDVEGLGQPQPHTADGIDRKAVQHQIHHAEVARLRNVGDLMKAIEAKV